MPIEEGRCFGYTIYKNPEDCPNCYVVRGWNITDAGVELEPEASIATEMTDKALEVLRQSFREMGLSRINRNVLDDPVILESWV